MVRHSDYGVSDFESIPHCSELEQLRSAEIETVLRVSSRRNIATSRPQCFGQPRPQIVIGWWAYVRTHSARAG